MPRATDGLAPAPLLTPFFARQNGRPGKVGHNVALRHSADKPVETVYKDCFPNVNSDLIVQIDNSHTIVERLCFFLIK